VVVLLCSLAAGQPRKAPPPRKTPATATGKQPTAAQAAEIARLEKELQAAQMKQANFAALKLAKQLYELQKKATGPTSQRAIQRKQTLAGLLSMTGDYAGAEKHYTEILRATEQEKGKESREALWALAPLTGVYWAQSRYEDLEPIVQRQLALTKKLDGEKSTAYASQ